MLRRRAVGGQGGEAGEDRGILLRGRGKRGRGVRILLVLGGAVAVHQAVGIGDLELGLVLMLLVGAGVELLRWKGGRLRRHGVGMGAHGLRMLMLDRDLAVLDLLHLVVRLVVGGDGLAPAALDAHALDAHALDHHRHRNRALADRDLADLLLGGGICCSGSSDLGGTVGSAVGAGALARTGLGVHGWRAGSAAAPRAGRW